MKSNKKLETHIK